MKACPNDTAAPDCLTAAQRKAIAAIYAPATAGTQPIYPGQPVGGENDEYGWRQWITGVDQGLLAGTNGQASSLQMAFAPELFKYMVFENPNWDYTAYDLANWSRDTKALAPILNADNPDLSALKARGGKLIIWHGWADPALNAVSTINYYTRVRQRDPSASTFTRLYLLPGVEHCNGGSGPAKVDWLTALTDWVEHGKAPERLVSCEDGPRPPAGAHTPDLSVSATRRLHGVRQHRRRAELRVQEVTSALQASGYGSAHATISVPAGPLAQW